METLEQAVKYLQSSQLEVFLKISQNLHYNTSIGVSYLIKFQGSGNFYEHLFCRATANGSITLILLEVFVKVIHFWNIILRQMKLSLSIV